MAVRRRTRKRKVPTHCSRRIPTTARGWSLFPVRGKPLRVCDATARKLSRAACSAVSEARKRGGGKEVTRKMWLKHALPAHDTSRCAAGDTMVREISYRAVQETVNPKLRREYQLRWDI